MYLVMLCFRDKIWPELVKGYIKMQFYLAVISVISICISTSKNGFVLKV